MIDVLVQVRVHLLVNRDMEDLDETAVDARIAADGGEMLRTAHALDGAICIADVELVDELVSAVQRLCFEGTVALLTDGAVVDYPYFSSAESAQMVASGDIVVLSGSDIPERRIPRRPLICALYACGVRWLAILDKIRRTPDANHLRPFAATAQSMLAAAGLDDSQS